MWPFLKSETRPTWSLPLDMEYPKTLAMLPINDAIQIKIWTSSFYLKPSQWNLYLLNLDPPNEILEPSQFNAVPPTLPLPNSKFYLPKIAYN